MPGPILKVVPFLFLYSSMFLFICYLLRNKVVFGKKFGEYLWPVRFYILGAVVGVAWQYVGLYGSAANVGQILWEAMSILSVITLVKKSNFNLKNVLALGVLYSLLIHGSKVSIRYFIYGAVDPMYRTAGYLSGRFFYGSILVMSLSVLAALAFNLVKESNKKEKNGKKIFLYLLGVSLTVAALLVSIKIYGLVK